VRVGAPDHDLDVHARRGRRHRLHPLGGAGKAADPEPIGA
jgi:hypothetical protein